MSTGSKGFAEYLVDRCQRNPRFAFFLIPLGVVIAYWGISDAHYYQSLRGRPTLVIKDVAVVTMTNDRGFSVPHVTGKTADKEVSIPISPKMARNAEFGDEVEVIETNDKPVGYVLRSTVDNQLSQIYFTIAGFPLNFIAILGIAIATIACAWGAFAKPTPEGT